ncbi:pyridoxal phosphate-dependent aminotransferase [Myxococcota bacterium]|nr:pyridoxal phosphate-dependent aminotransferase [Myxococcota bacterium]
MSIAQRAQALPASPIRRLAPFARQAIQEGVDVIPLNIGQPDVPSPPQFLESVRAYAGDLVPYSASEGDAGLLAAIARDFDARLGVPLEPWQVLIAMGGSEALYFTMQVIADAGDNIVVPEPFYTNYRFQAWSAGVELRTVPCEPGRGFRLPSVDALMSRVDGRTRAVLVNSPNNPSGEVIERGEFQALLDACTARGLWLMSDEVYREIVYDGAEVVSALQLRDPDGRVLVIDSLSKRYDLCGARIGMLVTRSREVRDACLKFCQARLSAPTLDQVAAARMMGAVGPDYFEEVRRIYRSRRDAMMGALADVEGVRAPIPRGAFYALLDLPVDDAESFCRWLLSEFRWEGSTVHLTPAEDFYLTPGFGRSQVRMAFVVEEPRIRKAAAVLRHAIPAYPGRTI